MFFYFLEEEFVCLIYSPVWQSCGSQAERSGAVWCYSWTNWLLDLFRYWRTNFQFFL